MISRRKALRYKKLKFHYGHIRWLLLVITYPTKTSWQREYVSPLKTKCSNFLLDVALVPKCIIAPAIRISTSELFRSSSLVFDWCSMFYSCFMPFP